VKIKTKPGVNAARSIQKTIFSSTTMRANRVIQSNIARSGVQPEAMNLVDGQGHVEHAGYLENGACLIVLQRPKRRLISLSNLIGGAIDKFCGIKAEHVYPMFEEDADQSIAYSGAL
jgi:hypothetical protein